MSNLFPASDHLLYGWTNTRADSKDEDWGVALDGRGLPSNFRIGWFGMGLGKDCQEVLNTFPLSWHLHDGVSTTYSTYSVGGYFFHQPALELVLDASHL